MAPKSRAEYFRERRKKLRQLVFMVDPEKAEALDALLEKQGKSRAEWFRGVLNETLANKEGNPGNS